VQLGRSAEHLSPAPFGLALPTSAGAITDLRRRKTPSSLISPTDRSDRGGANTGRRPPRRGVLVRLPRDTWRLCGPSRAGWAVVLGIGFNGGQSGRTAVAGLEQHRPPLPATTTDDDDRLAPALRLARSLITDTHDHHRPRSRAGLGCCRPPPWARRQGKASDPQLGPGAAPPTALGGERTKTPPAVRPRMPQNFGKNPRTNRYWSPPASAIASHRDQPGMMASRISAAATGGMGRRANGDANTKYSSHTPW
jgi:hypothetical protein